MGLCTSFQFGVPWGSSKHLDATGSDRKKFPKSDQSAEIFILGGRGMEEVQTYLVLSSFPADDSFRYRSNVPQNYPRQDWMKTFVADSLRTERGHIG